MIKKQLLYSLVFSYIAIVIVGIGLYTTLNVIATHSIEEEITKNYDSMLENLTVNVDYILKDVKDITLTIKEKVNVRRLLFLEEDMHYQDNYKFVEAIKELDQVKSYNSFIKDIYVYYKDRNIVLSGKGIYYPDIAYKTFHKGQEGYYDKWLELIKQGGYKGELIKIGNQLIHVETLSTYNKEKFANIAIIFNCDRLETTIKEAPISADGILAVLDENHNILLSNIDDQEWDGELVTKYRENKDYVKMTKLSQINNLEYVGIIPNKVFRKKVSYINQVFLLFTGVFIGILLIGTLVIYKKYGQVRRILNKIKGLITIGENSNYGEIEYIEKAFLRMHEKLEGDKFVIIDNILRKAIDGTEQNQKEIEKYLGEQFPVSQFVLASLVLDDKMENETEIMMSNFIIQNIFQEVLGDSYKLHTVDYLNAYILIINFNESYEEYMYEEIMHKLSQGRNFLEEKLGLSYIVSLSNIHGEMKSLVEAYTEVQRTLEYRMFFMQDKVISYSEIIKEDTPYIYSIEEQIKLTKYIKEGSKSRAIELLNKIFEQNFAEKNLSLGKTKKLIYDISITLEHIGHELGLRELDFIHRVSERKNLDNIQIEFEEIVSYLCEFIQVNKEKEVDDRIQNIIDYIKEHYAEEDLTVTSLAEVFQMKVSYISRFFKENTGENLLQYITKYRIKQAKKILIETDKNLNEIAEQVGLLNNVALIRCFKKYEYMTPNEYRSLNK